MRPVNFCLLIFTLSTFKTFQGTAQTGKDQDKLAIKSLIESRKYIFNAQSATSQRGKTVQLTSEYFLKLNKDSLNVDLPYYGRAYSTAYPGNNDIAMRFESNDFSYEADSAKKGGWDITIKPKKEPKASAVYLSVSAGGYCTVRIISNNRDQISYYGTITALHNK
jgi:hypothetical protein